MNAFPHLVQTSETTFAGIFRYLNSEVPLFITLPEGWVPGKSLAQTHIATLKYASEALHSPWSIFQQRLAVIRNLDDFFTELNSFLKQHVCGNDSNGTIGPNVNYTELIEDLAVLEDHETSIETISSSTFRIKLQRNSLGAPGEANEIAKGNEKTAVVLCSILDGYPSVSPKFTCCDIPPHDGMSLTSQNQSIEATSQNGGILNIKWSKLSRFSCAKSEIKRVLSLYHPYWSELEDIDANSKVLGATSLSSPWRVLSLGNFASMRFKVDPQHPRKLERFLPFVEFQGEPTRSLQFREAWLSRNKLWNDDVSILANLGHILELTFTSTPDDDMEEDEASCAICFEGDNAEYTLDIFCSCRHVYHRDCLASVFRRAGKLAVLNVLHGECLYCQKIITIRIG